VDLRKLNFIIVPFCLLSVKIRAIIKKFLNLPRKKKLLHLEAFFYQLSIGLLLKFIPFRYIPKLFAAASHLTPHSSHLTPLQSDLEEIRYVTWSVSRFIPWKNKCLIKSLAARKMLSGRGIVSQLSMGVLKDENSKAIAHAWIKSGEFEIVGKDGDYFELYLF
jgi:hypothetical protein